MVDVREALEQLVDLDLESADLGSTREALSRSARVRAWLDAFDVGARRHLDDLGRSGVAVCPDDDLARHGHTSRKDAAKVARRQSALDLLPQLEDSLAAGDTSGAHVDALANGLGQLSADDRAKLLDTDGDRLARLAKRQTPDEYTKTVRDAVADAQSDGGVQNLERQKRACRLKWWHDQVTGMLHLSGQFDPESGLKIVSRLRQLIEEMFHTQTPDGCPDDPSAKQDYLAALALVNLVEGNTQSGSGSGSGRPAFVIVTDYETMRSGLHEHSIIDLGDPNIVLPVETLRRLACEARIIPVVLDGHGVTLDLGRSSRLASEAQRFALRAMYPHCIGPDCTVAFDKCDIHHFEYWEHGGNTDLIDMGPACNRCHHRFHEGGWKITIDPTTRVITFTLPDGTTRTSRPPHARAA